MKKIIFLLSATLLCLNSFAQNNLNDIRIKYEHGNLALDAGYYPEALKIFEDCLQKTDSLPEAKYGAAKAAYYIGNNRLAKKYVLDVMNSSNAAFKNQKEYKEVFKLAALIEDQEKSTIEMVFVKGGRYIAGCQESRDVKCEGEEVPAHPVEVSDFYIAKFEVTQALWTKVMGNNPSGFSGCNDCPVENVSWDSIQVFISKLNFTFPGIHYRLPTEGEWEFAARGGNKTKGYKYCGSNNSFEVSWYDSNSVMKTHPVGLKIPNELGLYDMGGNVWEWCSDCFGSYTLDAQVNPRGLLNCTHRTDRGGCWQYTSKYTTPGTRGGLNPNGVSNDLGFRLARSISNK